LRNSLDKLDENAKAIHMVSAFAADAKQIASAVRAHWSIENSVHWVLDVTFNAFNEDRSRIRTDHAPENMAVVRHIALNMLNSAKRHASKARI